MSEDETRPEGEQAADAAAAGLSHLQAAALELISAGRSFLDAADSAIRTDETMSKVVDTLAELGRDVVARATAAAEDAASTNEDTDDDGYQGIDVDG